MKSLAAISAAIASAPFLFEGCAGGLVNYRTKLSGDAIIIPQKEAMVLQQPNGLMVVHARGLNGPVVLRNVEHEIVALSAICTHRGCEVRPFPDSYECPCHGSVYDLDGSVIEGPARKPLQRFRVKETLESLIIKIS